MDEPKEKKYYKIRTKNTFEVKMGLKNLCLLRLKLKILVLLKNYVHRKKSDRWNIKYQISMSYLI